MFSKQKPQEFDNACRGCLARDSEIQFLRSRLSALEEALTAKSQAEAAHTRILTEMAKTQMSRDSKDTLAETHFSPTVEVESPFRFVVEESR